MEAALGEWERASAPRRDGAVTGCGPAVASNGGQSSWRNEEERSRVTATGWGKERERVRGQGAGTLHVHGKVVSWRPCKQ